ncbi:HNH endonuclease signature motif containing protein, partial [Mycolicibacterium moriokaense]|uniref:HNH endonuclease signature motif containing protein n=1 Tax=Mycolicibacterium moriokaense TaxID=39691 RepID=UPI001A981EF2
AACAQRLFASADELERLYAASGSVEREQWCLDNWGAVAASIAAAQHVSLGVASHQLSIAVGLRERLPRVAEVFAAGAVNYRLVSTVVARTRLVKDPDVMAKLDTEIAARLQAWGPLSAIRTAAEVDYWVERYDPMAVRRTEYAAQGLKVDIDKPDDGSGAVVVIGRLIVTDGDALDQRLDAMARAVCDNDPRTLDQRRSAALGALGHGADRLACGCGDPGCAAAERQPSAVVVHVIASEDSLTDDTPAQLDGTVELPPADKPLREMTIAEALDRMPAPPPAPAASAPAMLLGGAMLPAPLLAAKVAGTAKLVWVRHPGNAAAEPRYIPSAVLATFVRCRDMTCRFPGCDEPAHHCDIDHTLAYPGGPTQASNLKCLCRKHHLLKTFWGWHDEQLPDGTVTWTSPQGQTYTTHPGSRLWFPSLCRPTAPLTTTNPDAPATSEAARRLAMPRRSATRAQNRAKTIDTQRAHNHAAIQAQARAHDQQADKTRTRWGVNDYFPPTPPPPDPHDPPPF